MDSCIICEQPIELLYQAREKSFARDYVVSSQEQIGKGCCIVRLCLACGHAQTDPLPDIGAYYAQKYYPNQGGRDDCVISVGEDHQPIFRNKVQIADLLAQMQLPQGATVLDYGAGDGTMAAGLLKARPDLKLYLFDVTERHRDRWQAIVPEERCAAIEIPHAWTGQFDAIYSLFVMEHVVSPPCSIASLIHLLQPCGDVYVVVPDPVANPADLIVCDHVSHFSQASLKRLLFRAGFESVSIEQPDHGWWMSATARLHARENSMIDPEFPSQKELASACDAFKDIAQRWHAFPHDMDLSITDPSRSARLATTPCHEAGPDDVKLDADAGTITTTGHRIAIYGAGVYGLAMALQLEKMGEAHRISCFLDRNPHLHGQERCGRPILAPSEKPRDVKDIFVGLAPRQARAAMDAAGPWLRDARLYYFLGG